MFLTPRMPARDPLTMVSSDSPSFGAHQGGSQRGTMGRLLASPLPENRRYAYDHEATDHLASLARLPARLGLHGDGRSVPDCPPTTTMAAPAHGAYSEPRPSMIMRELPHRLPDRRERCVLGRASPYARPSYDRYSSPRHDLHQRELHAESMVPLGRGHHSSQYMPALPSPGQQRRHQSSHDMFFEEALPRGLYAAPFIAAPPPQNDQAGINALPPYHTTHTDDWRDQRPELASSHAPWAYSAPPPPPTAAATREPRSPASLPRAAASSTAAASPPTTRTADPAPSPLLAPDLTLVGQLCAKRNCYRQACPLYGDFCEFHKPSRLCKVPECRKCAKTGGYCIAHGGGRRCQAPGCTKSAKEGGRCIAHGGGKRCQTAGCDKAATAGGLCATHA